MTIETFRPGERSLLLDPAGVLGIREPGIDLLVYPESLEFIDPSLIQNDLTASGIRVYGASSELYSFRAVATLSESDYRSLKALEAWQNDNELEYETVLYFLWDQVSEISATPSRTPVPSTSVTDNPLTTPFLSEWRYYPVLQGVFRTTGTLSGLGAYKVTFEFFEGSAI